MIMITIITITINNNSHVLLPFVVVVVFQIPIKNLLF